MKFIISFLILTFNLTCLCAQEADSTPYTETESTDSPYEENEEKITHSLVEPRELTREYQREKISVKKFDNKKWKEVVGTTNYNEEAPKVQPKEKEDKSQGAGVSKPWGGELLRIIFYALAVVVLIFLVYSVLNNISIKKKIKNKTITPDDLTAAVENIEDVQISSLLEQAIADRNFRLAARLYYLDLLKRLNELGIITWKKNKTNRDYLTEIFSHDYYFEDVKGVTLAYEQVWYGEHTLTQESFHQLASKFEIISQKLNTHKTP